MPKKLIACVALIFVCCEALAADPPSIINRMLTGTSDSRREAIYSAREFDAEVVLPTLIEIAGDVTEEGQLRLTALYSIRKKGDKAAAAIPMLTRILHDEKSRKLSACGALPVTLEKVGGVNDNVLMDLLSNPKTRRIGLTLNRRRDIDAALAFLKGLMAHEQLAGTAFQGIGELGAKAAQLAPELIRIVEGKAANHYYSSLERAAALNALGEVSTDEQRVPWLIDLMKGSNLDLAVSATKQLGSFSSEDVVKALNEAAKDHRLDVKSQAKTALHQIRYREMLIREGRLQK